MPNQANHLSTARDNHAVSLSLLEDGKSLAWATTIAFYSALHLVEAAFAHEGKHFDNHPSRNQHLKTVRNLQNIWKHYKPLYDHSLRARYLTDEKGSAEELMIKTLGVTGVRDRVLNHHLRQVEKSVAKILGLATIFDEADS